MADAETLAQARVDIARLEATVAAQGRELGEVKELLKGMAGKVDTMAEQLTEARGGAKTLMLLGGAAATLGGALTWLAQHLLQGGPR